MKFRLISLIFLFPLFAMSQSTWKQEGNDVLELSTIDKTLVRFILGAAPKDPHFEILATADGRNTVWASPPDHLWHYGIWFSWKSINGVNFWEADVETGLQEGHNEIRDARITSHPEAESAFLSYQELAYPDKEGSAVLLDSVEIHVTRPQNGLGPRVEWKVTTTALEDVVLGRRAVPGEPGGKSWGGYAGFSWRGADTFKDIHITDSIGNIDDAIHFKTSPWVNIAGLIDDAGAGLTIVPYASKPYSASTWYVSKRFVSDDPKLPFYYVSPGILMPEEIHLKKGESITHRYLVLVHDGDRTASQNNELVEEFKGCE